MTLESERRATVFWLLLGASALAGVASVPYLVDIASQVPGMVPGALAHGGRLYLFTAIQSLLFTLPTAWIGLTLAPRVGLGLLTSPIGVALRRAIVAGLAMGVLLVAGSALAEKHLPQISMRAPAWWKGLLASLSAGVNEEIWFRLGVMTMLMVGGAALFGRRSEPAPIDAGSESAPVDTGSDPPLASRVPTWVRWTACVISALLFGALHLPQADAITSLTPGVVAYALVGNGILGVLLGWLYWKHGLLSAMVAHASTDVVLHVVAPLAIP